MVAGGVGPWIAVGLALLPAWLLRFVQDDAFISFRYARHLAEGLGLVWNPGQPIEGYTNFIWTVGIAGAMKLGLEPIAVSYAFGLLSYAVTLRLTYALGAALGGGPAAGYLALGLTAANVTFTRYATGGLETQLQATLFVAAFLLLHRLHQAVPSRRRLVTLSLVLAASMLTRPDSALLLAVVGSAAAWRVLRSGVPVVAGWAALAGPFIAVVGGWLLWKLGYYGALLPNTFYAKAGSATSHLRGITFVLIWFQSYLWFLLLLLPLPVLPRLWRARSATLVAISALAGLWILYLIKVGGGFMEFRFFVPLVPLAMVKLVWVCSRYPERIRVWVQVAIALALLGGSVWHGRTYTTHFGIESIAKLERHLWSPDEQWVGIGKTLGRVFADDPDVTIAVTAAGAIPYYAKLRTIDMFGLNDAWVARNGTVMGSRPGHQRAAPLSYLIESGTHLAIGHPQIRRQTRESYSIAEIEQLLIVPLAGPDELPPAARVLEIDLGEGYRLLTLYLVPHPAVDAAIEREGWAVREIR